MRRIALICGILIAALAACESGAVVFAPTPPPPDLSPLRYMHPGGSFSIRLPRNWSVHPQNITTLATAAFSAPNEAEPVLRISVVNLGRELDSAAFGEFINQYQTQIRPDIGRYTEQDRQAMGDGSWRLTGLRLSPGGLTQPLNTFIARNGSFVGVIELIVPADPASLDELQSSINTFTLHTEAGLQPAQMADLAVGSNTSLELLHISSWSTPAGVFFITGEVANNSSGWLAEIPVRAVLRTSDDMAVAEAVDIVMGYGIPPGGFAPFSLRFGQGQPARTDSFELSLGSEDWQPDPQRPIVGQGMLTWTDDSELLGDGSLIVSGTVTNTGREPVYQLRAVITVFDAAQNVIAAGFTPVNVDTLESGATASFQLSILEIGGQPSNYIVSVQGLGE